MANCGSTMLPKAQGNCLLHVSASKETKDTGVCLPWIGQLVHRHFFFDFHFLPGHGNNVEGKPYLVVDLPVY